MTLFVDWLNSDEIKDLHPIELAALSHWRLVFLHPFQDGNGRTARLLMNLILMKANYPPSIILNEDRDQYFKLIKMANEGDVRPFIRFIGWLLLPLRVECDRCRCSELHRENYRRLPDDQVYRYNHRGDE